MLPGEACTAPAQGDTFVDTRGVSWKGSVTNLFSDTSYDCFVITNRRIGRPQCSKPVSITTKLLPPFVYSSNNVAPNSSLPASYKTERCFVGKNGNLADCMDTSLSNELAIVVGVVDPQKRWITFADNIQVTCPIGPMGTIDASECQTTYEPPNNFIIGTATFDPLAKRAWFAIYPNISSRSSRIPSKLTETPITQYLSQRVEAKSENIQQAEERASNYDGYIVTCGIDALGKYTGCTQSDPIDFPYLAGASQALNGYYLSNYSNYNKLQFCQNDQLFPCANITGIPEEMAVFYVQFFTDKYAYLTGSNSTSQITVRCIVRGATEFSDCNTVYASPGSLTVLQSANDGANAYNVVYYSDPNAEFEAQIFVCDVNQADGTFEDCNAILSYGPGQYRTDPIFSSPIIF